MTDLERYIIARWAYSVGEPIMEDAEYTLLDNAMKAQHPSNPYCNRSWSSDPCPTDLLRRYGYKSLIQKVVLSDKTESIPSLNSIVDVRSTYLYMDEPHSVSYKLDGWNIQASYYNGDLVNIQTRGRSMDAMDANALKPLIPNTLPIQGRALVVMECIIPDSEFSWFKKYYSATSQRGAVSTAIANGGNCLDHIALVAHNLRIDGKVEDKFKRLREFGFKVPMHATVSSYEELMNQIQVFSNYKSDYGYPTDGLVVEGQYTRAIRIAAWEEPVYQSYVTGYTETYGPHSIAIQCSIYPIRLPNSVQRQVPATNLSRIVSLNLRPGAPIAFRIASSAIADIDENATTLLQRAWEGRFPEFRKRIELNETLK